MGKKTWSQILHLPTRHKTSQQRRQNVTFATFNVARTSLLGQKATIASSLQRYSDIGDFIAMSQLTAYTRRWNVTKGRRGTLYLDAV